MSEPTFEELFDKLEASLIEDGIGHRKWSVNLLGHEYIIEVNKDDEGWHYSVWRGERDLADGEIPATISMFAKLVAAHFNNHRAQV